MGFHRRFFTLLTCMYSWIERLVTVVDYNLSRWHIGRIDTNIAPRAHINSLI